MAAFKVLCVFVMSCLLSLTAGADVIYLKNGKQIRCDSAWQEGKEVKYLVSNGTVGIPKSMVAKITKEAAQSRPAQTQTQRLPTTIDSSSQQAIQSIVKPPSGPAASPSQQAVQHTKEGIRLAEEKDLAGALESFQNAYDATQNEQTTTNLALVYFALKDDWNAELYFSELLKLNPQSKLALDYLGQIAWRGERLGDAADYWAQSLKIKEDPLIRAKLDRLKKESQASADYEHNTSRHFLIRYDGGKADPSLVREMSDFLEERCHDLSNQFDYYPSAPFVVILYPAQEYYDITDAPSWSGAINDGKIKLPVKGIHSLTDDLKRVLTHELAHSFIALKTSGNCPVWLQEGLAQYTEGKRVSDGGTRLLTTLIENKQLPSIGNLAGSFAKVNGRTAEVLYLESLAFTQYLIGKYQFYMINQFLEELGTGNSYNAAFDNAYSLPLTQADATWRNSFND